MKKLWAAFFVIIFLLSSSYSMAQIIVKKGCMHGGRFIPVSAETYIAKGGISLFCSTQDQTCELACVDESATGECDGTVHLSVMLLRGGKMMVNCIEQWHPAGNLPIKDRL